MQRTMRPQPLPPRGNFPIRPAVPYNPPPGPQPGGNYNPPPGNPFVPPPTPTNPPNPWAPRMGSSPPPMQPPEWRNAVGNRPTPPMPWGNAVGGQYRPQPMPQGDGAGMMQPMPYMGGTPAFNAGLGIGGLLGSQFGRRRAQQRQPRRSLPPRQMWG